MVALFQSLDFTSLTMKSLHSAAKVCHTANDRGTVARMAHNVTDGTIIAFIAVMALFALVCVAGLALLAYEDRKVARALRSTIDATDYIAPTIVNLQTVKGSY
jgi:hypothetical protein